VFTTRWVSAGPRLSPPRAAEAAATRLYGELADALPDARIVVLGPLSPPVMDPAGAAAVRSAPRASAESLDLPFIDPITDGWLTPPDGLFADDLHPNDVGYRQLADQLVRTLKSAGF